MPLSNWVTMPYSSRLILFRSASPPQSPAGQLPQLSLQLPRLGNKQVVLFALPAGPLRRLALAELFSVAS